MSGLHITFVLPVRGGGGGPNSVVQEALGLSKLGVRSTIAVNQENVAQFRQGYPEIGESAVAVAAFSGPEALGLLLCECDIACATTAMSVRTTAQALAAMPKERSKPRLAYYVQDYEPLFYEPETPDWNEAFASYTALPGAALFAKTSWICSMVEENHNVTVSQVRPSIDHAIYYPNFSRDAPADPVRISAMLRPRTLRRAPIRTVRILDWIVETFGRSTVVEVFGAPSEEIARLGVELQKQVLNHGRLRRTEVPAILRRSDLFLDLSDYQAFGRTALEAMASGCVPVVPLFGGTSEFARHGWNGFVVDTRSDAAIQEAVSIFMRSSPADREALRMNGLLTAADYSIHKAALSELAVFQKLMAAA